MAAGALAVLTVLAVGRLRAADDRTLYAGAEKCRLCHSAESKGSAFRKWLEGGHRKAYGSLIADKAKKIAKERSVLDPKNDKACLACHVTALDVPAEKKDKKFDQTLGVQCESCHGPGAEHVRRRLDELGNDDTKPVEIPKGEIVAVPPAKTCAQCHNDDSPTHKPFDYAKELKKISHLDSRKDYPADYLDKLGAQGGQGGQ